jgi:hypothetical protein
LLERNQNVRVVQDLLGHANLNTTQSYLGITDKAKVEAVQSLESEVEASWDLGAGRSTSPRAAAIQRHFDDLANAASDLVRYLEAVKAISRNPSEKVGSVWTARLDEYGDLPTPDDMLWPAVIAHAKIEVVGLRQVYNINDMAVRRITPEVIMGLRKLALRRTFRGTCLICADLSNKKTSSLN